MQDLIGHIAAVVIGGLLLLVVATLLWRGQQTRISSVQYATAKDGTLDFVRFLEEDLSNLGAGVPNDVLTDSAPNGSTGDAYEGGFYEVTGVAFDTSSATRVVRFCSWTDRATDIDPALNYCDLSSYVEYRWQQSGTVQVWDPATNAYVPSPTYLVERYVGGTKQGESVDSITHLRFDLLDTNEASTGTLADVRAIRVSVRAVSPLGGGEGYQVTDDPDLRYQVDQTRWTRTIRPPNLTRPPTS
ncbi:MAG: hypothetical protein R3181_06145 [Rubricoccaceae bacterium]|nr:hypothetical protein [Rubricoccaceae bacterium]